MNSRILFLSAMLALVSVELMGQTNSLAGLWRVQVSKCIDLMDPDVHIARAIDIPIVYRFQLLTHRV